MEIEVNLDEIHSEKEEKNKTIKDYTRTENKDENDSLEELKKTTGFNKAASESIEKPSEKNIALKKRQINDSLWQQDSSDILIEKDITPKLSDNSENRRKLKQPLKVRQESLVIVPTKSLNIFDEESADFIEKLNSQRKFFEFIINKTEEPQEVLKKMLSKCKYSFFSKDLEGFESELKICEENHLESIENGKKVQITFELFLKACENWHCNCKSPNLFRTQLQSSLWDFVRLKKLAYTDQDLKFINEMIHKIYSQITKIQNSAKKMQKKKKNAEILTEVFNFYIKQQKSVSKSQSFDSLDLQFRILTLQKFLYFCKDFKILKDEKNPKKIAVQLQVLKEIFQKHSDCSKRMSETQFFDSLLDISNYFLSEEYDSDHSTQFFALPAKEKLKIFLQIVGLTEKDEFRAKMIGCQQEKPENSRVADDDISKKYKFDLKKVIKNKESVKQWKISKKKSSSLSVNYQKIDDLIKDTKPITMAYLRKAKGNFDLDELIQEGSSDEELFKTLQKNRKFNLSQSISNKVLSRAQELSLIQQRSENKQIEGVLNGSKFITRVFKYSKK